MTPSVAVQIVKMVLGFLGGAACFAMVAFQKTLEYDLSAETTVVLLVAGIGGFGLTVHGAYNTPAPKQPPQQ